MQWLVYKNRLPPNASLLFNVQADIRYITEYTVLTLKDRLQNAKAKQYQTHNSFEKSNLAFSVSLFPAFKGVFECKIAGFHRQQILLLN